MGQVGLCGLEEEDRAQHVDGILPVEILCGDVFQGEVRGDACVVDDDVDLEFAASGVGEVVLGCIYEVGRAMGVAHFCEEFVSDAYVDDMW